MALSFLVWIYIELLSILFSESFIAPKEAYNVMCDSKQVRIVTLKLTGKYKIFWMHN